MTCFGPHEGLRQTNCFTSNDPTMYKLPDFFVTPRGVHILASPSHLFFRGAPRRNFNLFKSRVFFPQATPTTLSRPVACGHSIHANGVSYSFHLLPSGLINPNCMNFIGSGVVFHVPSFFKELKELDDLGLPGVYDRILVSDRVHIDLDLHAAVDGLEEVELGEGKIGTTGRGIGPSYSCKAARSGIRMAEVFDAELFESKLRRLASGYAKRYGDLLKYDVEEELARFNEYRPKLAKYAVDGVSLLQSAQKNNTKILVEGANALMLDLDMGSYPYVTSSTTSIAGIIGGLALNPRGLTEVIGVVKAYTTRNGMGSFKTEDLGEVGTKLQDVGREWGTSTGRKRRCGWLDLVVVRFSTATTTLH